MSGSRKKFRKSLKYLTNLDIPVSFRCSFPLFKCLLTLMLSCKIRSIKLLCNFIEIALRHGCSPVNLRHIFRTPLPKNTSGWLLLRFISQALRSALISSECAKVHFVHFVKFLCDVITLLEIQLLQQNISKTFSSF